MSRLRQEGVIGIAGNYDSTVANRYTHCGCGYEDPLQEELGHRSGVHRTYVGAVERGEYNVTILTLRNLTKTLGISLHDAIRGIV